MTLRLPLPLTLLFVCFAAPAFAQTEHAYRPQVIRPAVNQAQPAVTVANAAHVVQRPLRAPVPEYIQVAPTGGAQAYYQQPPSFTQPVAPVQAVQQAPPSLPPQNVYQQPAPAYQPVQQPIAQQAQPLQPVPSFNPIQPIPSGQMVTAYDPCTCQPITTYMPVSNYYTAASTSYYTPAATTPITPYTAQRQVVFRPVVAPFPMPSNYEVGRGIVGQPKIYVPGQPIRNFLRWVTP